MTGNNRSTNAAAAPEQAAAAERESAEAREEARESEADAVGDLGIEERP